MIVSTISATSVAKVLPNARLSVREIGDPEGPMLRDFDVD